MDARAIHRLEEARGFAMPTPAIPDAEQRALEMPVELLDKGKDIVAGKMVRRDGKRESEALAHGRDGDGPGHRKAVVAVPALMDRCLALRCPGTAHRGLQHAATLIKENDGTALTPGFL